MMKLGPTDRQVLAAIDQAIADLEAAKAIFPALRDHAGRWPLDRRPKVELDDKAALLAFLRALQDVQGATQAMEGRLPALYGAGGLAARPVAAPKACAECGTTRGPFRGGLCDRHRKRRERATRGGGQKLPTSESSADDQGEHRRAA